MDAFEIRMQFLNLLRRLNASQLSIQKTVAYAMKYFHKCGEDIWECLVEECQKGTLNARINILYLLDNLCETSLHYQATASSFSSGGGSSSRHSATGTRKPPSYIEFVTRDLDQIVQLVVPPTRDGLMNLGSARQILESWRTRRVLNTVVVDDLLRMLDERQDSLQSTVPASDTQTPTTQFSRDDVFRRIEEDRERHKILRQKRWHMPVHSGPQPGSVSAMTHTARLAASMSSLNHPSPTSPASPNPLAVSLSTQPASTSNSADFALDVEFENAWETTSDWNEDDSEAIEHENEFCFPPQPPHSSYDMDMQYDGGVGGGHITERDARREDDRYQSSHGYGYTMDMS